MNQGKQIGITPVAGGNGYIVSRDLSPRFVSVAGLRPLGRETRKHPPEQVRKLAKSLTQFGFVLPILIGPDRRVVAGWALVLAARQLGLAEVPVVSLADLSEAELRSLRLALNRLAEDSRWDGKELRLELSEIVALAPHVELEISGFEIVEIERILDRDDSEAEDDLPSIDTASAPATRPGDLWLLGEHRLFCSDPSLADSYDRLLGAERAAMVFSDGSRALAINGHKPGFGVIKHGNPAPASELSSTEGLAFLKTVFGHAAHCSIDGAIHFMCVPWQHAKEAIIAGETIYGALSDVCILISKTSNTRNGFLYSPEFKLVLVFQVGKAPPINNMARGRDGRHRKNIWDYARQKGLNESTKSKSCPRAAGKPVSMIADAIRDCSNEGGLILDPFGHMSTTLIAAERTRRRARVIERDPIFADRCIERWQRMTGGVARHAETGRPFARSGKAEGGASAGGE
jgi:ParB-like chromosome segregation protein Spo0J